ncbi:MAG: alpha/beta hydrolase [Alphaproteobacteria bacterium]|nr:alpha/beta hydrolase [Alphaproteobacteria bacterium]
MTEKPVPSLREPDGFKWGSFTNAKGADIRYGSLKAEGESKGTVVMLPGFRESVEKYFEAAQEMKDRGFDVWLMDWRGQGGSERYLQDNPQKMHHEGYDEQIETLHQFTQTVVDKAPSGPLIMSAHSMGAHIGLRYLKEHAGVFDSAMLSAPMLDINTGTLPKPLARQMAKFAKAGNYLDKYIPGGSDWSEEKNAFKDNNKTADEARFKAAVDIVRANPDLKTGDPTYGWVYHTFQSIDILSQEDYLKEIKTPILLQISEHENVVDKPAQERAAGLLPNCKRVDIAGAQHEIWHEIDALRKLWLDKVDTFLAERLSPSGPRPKKPEPSAPRPPKP